MRLKLPLIITLIVAVAGCSPESYRRSADLQVSDLLRDRTQRTLSYSPQTAVPTDPAPRPSPRAYERIPLSPIPPPSPEPIRREKVQLPLAPLGPEAPDSLPPTAEGGVSDSAAYRAMIWAPLGPPVPSELTPRFDLFACIEYAVQHSRSYQDQMENLYLSALDVTLERHLFSARPFARTDVNFSGGQAAVDYRAALNVSNSAGVRQRLPWGGEVVAQGLVDFVRAISDNAVDGESASVTLSGSLPLLRGAGMVNLESLIRSERQLIYDVRAFEDFRRSFAVDIASRYFALLASQQGLVNRRLNLLNLASITERTQALYDAGRLSFLEVQRALQERLSAESDLINAEEAYQSALDNFKLVLGMPVTERMDVAPIALDVTVPSVTVDEAIELAYRYRLDLKTAEDRVEDARRSVANARNSLLPSLDLRASSRLTNEAGEDFTQLEGDTLTYSAGVSLDLPIDRVSERNSYRRALISYERSRRNLEAQRDRVIASVRDALRSLRAAQTSVQIERRSIELANRRLDLANERLRQGGLSSRDLVEAQNSLLAAQDRYERARAQLQIRILEFMRDTGTLRLDPAAGALGRAMDRQSLGDRS